MALQLDLNAELDPIAMQKSIVHLAKRLTMLLATLNIRILPKRKKAVKKSTVSNAGSSKSSGKPPRKRSGSMKSGSRNGASPKTRKKPGAAPKRTSTSTRSKSGASKVNTSSSTRAKKAASRSVRTSKPSAARQANSRGTRSASKSIKTSQSPRRAKSPRPARATGTQKRKTGAQVKLSLAASSAFFTTQLNQLRVKTRQLWANGQSASKRARSRLALRMNKPQVQVRGRQRTVQPAGSRRKRRGEHVRLAGAVEHRCPYCLELVETRDARGVRICPDCGTRHHADCWSVTGTCQVPHE